MVCLHQRCQVGDWNIGLHNHSASLPLQSKFMAHPPASQIRLCNKPALCLPAGVEMQI